MGPKLYNFLRPYYTNVHNRLSLSQVGFFSLIKCLWVRPGAYPGVERLKGALLGQATYGLTFITQVFNQIDFA
jgi:hypothetical protein